MTKKLANENFKTLLNNLISEKKESGRNVTKDLTKLGIHRNTLAGYKKGKLPTYNNLIILAKYFEVSVSYLVGETNSRKADNLEICNKLGISDKTLLNLQSIKKVNDEGNNIYSDLLEKVFTNVDLYCAIARATFVLDGYADNSYKSDIIKAIKKEYSSISSLDFNFKYDDFIDILISQKFLEIYHNYKLHRNIDSLNDDKLLNKKENLQNEITMLQHELNIINNKLNLSE